MLTPSVQLSNRPRIKTLDALRGIAALTVVVAHCTGNINYNLLIDKTPLYLFKAAHEAVIFFFLLSGYVLVYQFKSKPKFSYPGFITSRVFRIYLPYLAAIVLSLALYFVGTNYVDETFFGSLWSTAIEPQTIWNHLLLIGNFNTNQLNHVIWSLVHEMRIAILFPLILIVLRWRTPVAVGACLLVTLLSAILIVFGVLPSHGFLNGYLYTSYYLSLFIAGGLIVIHQDMLVSTYVNLARRKKTALIVTALMMYTYAHTVTSVLLKLHLNALLGYHFLFEDLITTMAAIIIMVGAIALSRKENFLDHKVFSFFGRISYSLYLVHIPILSFLYKELHSYTSIYVILALGIPLSIISAQVFNSSIERTAARFGKRLATRFAPKEVVIKGAEHTLPLSDGLADDVREEAALIKKGLNF